MRILVHMCCGPCGITVLQRLADAGHDLVGLFFNPNIQPLAEYLRRREGAINVTEKLGVPLILADTLPFAEQAWAADETAVAPSPVVGQGTPFPISHSHDSGSAPDVTISSAPDAPAFRVPLPDLPPAVNPIPWLRAVAGHEESRCLFCWNIRLRKTAQLAKSKGFDGFASSLLYSRYQDHDRLRRMGEALAASTGQAFVYQDFRTSWQQGIDLSKEWGIYRQQYCGCVYSEYDRYARDCRKATGM